MAKLIHREVCSLKIMFISVMFNGTTRLGEAMATTLQFVSDVWQIQQRFVRFSLLAKSMTGDEIACEVFSARSTGMGIHLIVSLLPRGTEQQ